jgi:BirA family biotin operon repressor/biotin-[acetyl-CoA-carboxylase] ligase
LNAAPPASPPDGGRLESLLESDPFVTRLIVLESVDSTNAELRRLASAGAPEGTVVVAGRQSAGRGRRGRTWYSEPGLGLYLSLLLRPCGEAREATRWTVAASVAACGACRCHCGNGAVIKWPNDVMFEGRKLGGILVEMRSAGGRPQDLVVGIGLNVNHRADDFPPELREAATSLHLATGRGMLELEPVAAGLLARLGEAAARLAQGEWDGVVGDWERLAPAARGCRVKVLGGPGEGAEREAFEGITRGLDADGALRVERRDGRIVPVRLAESVAVVR